MSKPQSSIGRRLAEAADKADDLTRFRKEFVFGEEGVIYLNGNSLGRLSKRSQKALSKAIDEEWGTGLVRSWGTGWLSLPGNLGTKIAALIGAQPDEVLVADSTSINLFKLASAALKLRERKVIWTDSQNFPSDLYVLSGLAEVRVAQNISELLANIGDDTALVALTHTNYLSGEVHEMGAITEAVHKAGAFMLWDLSHSVGVMPLHLNTYHVDFAVGCTYKYLNGGPGAPAFLFVRQQLMTHLENPIRGWFGHEHPFRFSPEYEPASGISRFLTGTPPVLSMAALEPALDLIAEAGLEKLRKKAFLLTEYLITLLIERVAKYDVTILSPRDGQKRGAHVAVSHSAAWKIAQALKDQGVIPDFREPDILRFGLAPIYTSFLDVYDAVVCLETILAGGMQNNYSDNRVGVT